MNKIIAFVLFWAGLLPMGFANNSYVDSLQNLLKANLTATQQVSLQQQLADWYRANEQYPQAIQMAQNSLKSARRISKNNLEMTKSYWILSNIYTNTQDFEKSQKFIDSAYHSAQNQKKSLAAAYANYASAVLHTTLFDSEKTVQLLHQALSQIGDKEREPLLTARIYYLLYGVYTEWNDEAQALNYIHKSLEFAQKSKNINMLANCYTAISVVFSFKYETTHQKQHLDSTMLYLDHAILLQKQYPDQVPANTYANSYNNKASYYLKYYNIGDPEIKQKIRQHINEALRVAPSTNEEAMASSYGMLSELSMEEGDLHAAEMYLNKAYIMLAQKKKPYYHTLINVLNSMVSLYTKKSDFKKALDFQQKVAEYSNLLFNEEMASTTKRFEAQYELTKKEQEIKSLQEKATNQQTQKYFILGLFALAAIGSFFMFRSYHFNLKYALAREKQLTSEKNESSLQIKYEKEERARMQLEQELLELQQQKLQNEVMTSQLQLQHKSKVLQQVKEKLTGAETANIQQILREESLTDTEFEKAKFRITELHPNFFKNINEHSKQKLTALDQKYCAYFYLDMDTKQIANLLHVEPKSVRMTKYRIKQKFGLDSQSNLTNYLKMIV